MKRQRRMFLARAAMTLLLAVLTTVGTWAESLGGYNFDTEGEGASKVYLINNETDLEHLAAYVNAGNHCSGLTFKLNAPITMTAVAAGQSNHTPIGNYENSNSSKTFRGTFDGNHNSISGMTIYMPDKVRVGLFGYLANGAVVKDLTLTDCHITGKNLTGGIAGDTEGSSTGHVTIENCHVSGENIATVEANYHGGIAGRAKYTDITGCTVSGTLSGISGSCWGGILGYISGNVNVTSCENAANITLTTSVTGCGGILGSIPNYGTSVSNCLNRGTVSAGSSAVGAICGNDEIQFFTNCYYVPFNDEVKAFVQYNSTQTIDAAGNGEPVYTVTTGSNISTMTTTPDASVTSAMTGTKYYKAGTFTLTLTPVLPAGYELVKYTCEGGVLDNNDETLLQVADGDHTLVISNANVTIDALVALHREDITGDGFTLSGIPAEMRWRGTGVAVEPAFTLRNGETLLAEGTDYLVAYTNNTAIASADGENAPTITITGINGYKGTITRTFAIADFHLQNPDAANSEENPYQVATEDDLEALASIVNTGTRAGGYYLQTQPITMTQEHTAIGTDNRYFTGHYNGGNKTISNLTINKPNESYQGLFGDVENSGTIKYVVLDNCDITGGDSTGGIVGYLGSGEVAYCTVSGAIKVAEGQSANRHGGIAGYNGKTVRWCVNTASVTGAGACHGGICGEIYWTESHSQNNLNMGVVEGTSYVGSFCGKYNILSQGYAYNYHTVNTTGIFGSEGAATGYDPDDTDYKSCAVAEITVADGMTLTPNDEATYTWGERVFYKRNKNITFTCTVPDGRLFDHYEVSGGSISNPDVRDGSHQLTALTATPVEISTVFANTVTATTSLHGTFAVSPATQAPDNSTVTVTLTPDAGYTVGQVVYNDGTADHVVTADVNGIYSFVMPANDVTVSATFTPDPAHFAQSGDTYTIIDATGWSVFCDLLATEAKGYFTGKTVMLGADNIEVSRCAGSGSGESLTESDRPFTGTFDGQGNTLIFNYGTAQEPANEDYIAPFRYTDGATISGLHVSGNIYTQHTHAAGIIGLAYGTTNISNCRSSVNIVSSITGDGTHGGLFACTWTGSTTNIEGCLFDGSIQSASGFETDRCGGFIGWKNGTINVTNCLLTADLSTIGSNGSYTFVRTGLSSIANSYYTAALGATQGKAARTVTAGDNVTMTFSGTAKEYGVSGITAYITGKDANDKDIYGVGIIYNNKVYASNGDAVSLTLSNNTTGAPLGYRYAGYSVTDGATITGNETDGFTLQMADQDVTLSVDNEGALRSTGEAVSINYMNADGTTYSHNAIALDGTETTLAAGWYFVGKDIRYTQTVNLGDGEVTIILCDGVAFEITGNINVGRLNFYGQNNGTGSFYLVGTIIGDVNQYGGSLVINGQDHTGDNEMGDPAIEGNLNFYGGTFAASGGQSGYDTEAEMYAYAADAIYRNVTLSWRNTTDEFSASSIGGYVTIAEGKAFIDNDDVVHTSDNVGSIDNMILRPYLIPLDLAATNVTATSATLNWTGGLQSYNVRYRTAAADATDETILSEDFEDGSCQGWTNNGGWGDDEYLNHKCFSSDGWYNPYLISPVRDLSTYKSATLNFRYIITPEVSGDPVSFTVCYRINGGEWNTLWTNNSENQDWTESGNIALPNPSVDYEIGFAVTNSSTCAYIDDIVVTGSGYGEWQTVNNIAATTTTITGLTSGETYQWQVQGITEDGVTPWSETDTFNTLINIKMNSAGIKTYASPYDLDFTDIDGLTAYVASSISGSTLTLTPVTKVPGGTGLLLKGTAGADFTVPTTGSATAITDNLMVGVLSAETVVQQTETVENVDYTNFILANGNYGIDWYTLSEAGAIGANKAYLRVPTSSGARLNMVFGDDFGDATRLNDNGKMINDNEAGAWYTVDGVKLNGKPTRKGLYIFNGKKTVIR